MLSPQIHMLHGSDAFPNKIFGLNDLT